MKRRENMTASAAFAVAGKYIYPAVFALLTVIFFGCATAPPMPVTIRHERTPSMSDASLYNQQYQRSAAVQKVLPQPDQEVRPTAADKRAASPVEMQPWKEPDGVVSSVDLQAGTEKAPAETASAVTKTAQEPVDEDSSSNVERTASREPADEQSSLSAGRQTDPAPVDEESPSTVDQPDAQESAGQQIPSAAGREHDQESSPEDSSSKGDPGIAALVALLKEKNLISPDEASHILEKSEAQANISKQSIQDQVRNEVNDKVSEVRDEVRDDVRDQVKSEVRYQVKSEIGEALPKEISKVEQSLPDWTKRIRFSGDIRLRYENDRYDKNNAEFAKPSDPNQLMNTRINQNKFKYRLRFGTEAQVSEQLTAFVRLSTGNTSTPVSTNTILGDYMNKDSIVFDLAYLRWQPTDFMTISGGRIPNPWITPSWLVWDDDLNFEGLALHAIHPVSESWTTFLTAGVFPLNDYDFSSHSKWLMGGQLGLERKSEKGISAKIGAAYYHFSNITGVRNNASRPNATDWTAPQYQQKGNTLFNISADNSSIKTALASQFRELNVGGTIDIGFWDPYHVVLIADYVKNLGFNQSKVNAVVGDIKLDDPNDPSSIGFQETPRNTTGYQIGAYIGYPAIEKFGQWKAQLQYKYIGADAVVDAFTDSDFHLGGTNAKGWILGADFGLLKNSWLALKWITANEISGPPLAIDVLFVDFNARF